MSVSLSGRETERGAGALGPAPGTAIDVTSLLARGRLEAKYTRQLALTSGRVEAVRPHLGWKPGEESPFTPAGLDRVIRRRGALWELVHWKLDRGASARRQPEVGASAAVVVEVSSDSELAMTATAVRTWCLANPGVAVVVEVSERALLAHAADGRAVGELRGAGAGVAVFDCSGTPDAVRALRLVEPEYMRLDGAKALESPVEAVAIRMAALVAASEGWKTVLTGLGSRDGIDFARTCAATRMESSLGA